MAGTHFDNSKPHLMSSFTDEWPCRSWTFKTLADLLGNKKFSCRITEKSCDQKMETQCSHHDVTIKEFCDWLDGTANDTSPLSGFTREENCCYIDYKYMKDMFEEDHPRIYDEVCWEDFGLVDYNGYDSTIWLSSEGANTPCHQDTYGFNLVTQIYGRKLWILFPPEDSKYLYPTRIPYEESSIFTEVNVRKPDLHSHPQFKLSHPYAVTLQPGQTLYVPRHWWHYVESLEPSISINVWVPMREDSDSRFSEAITRCLATSLISSLDTSSTGQMQSEWLNPTESLDSPTMNLMLLKASLCPLLEDSHCLTTGEEQDVTGDSLCECVFKHHCELSQGMTQGDSSHSTIKSDLSHGMKEGDLSCGLNKGDCSQELKQGDISNGIKQSDLSHGTKQCKISHGKFHQCGFQSDKGNRTADDSESYSQRTVCSCDSRTCQNVQKDASTDAGNVLAGISPTDQSERPSGESVLTLFIDKMKLFKMFRTDSPFQCDFDVNSPLKTANHPQGSSAKKPKIFPDSGGELSNSEEIGSIETSDPRVMLIKPCSFDSYLKLLDGLCRKNQCGLCCKDSKTANGITKNCSENNNFLTGTNDTRSAVSQHKGGKIYNVSFETADGGNISCLKGVHSPVSDSRKRKTLFDCEDDQYREASGAGSKMDKNFEIDKVSETVDSGSLAAGGCSELSHSDVAEMLLSCATHPDVVKMISQLFREQCQRRLNQLT